MTDEMREEYLWDRSGPPDPQTQRLERLLGRYRHEGGEPELPEDRGPPRLRLLPLILAAAAIVVAVLGVRTVMLGGRDYYRVEGIAGIERVHAGDSFETGAGDATVYVASIGDVELGPGSRMRVENIAREAHHLYLERGRLSASIFAAPQVFQVGTPAGWSIDLGCEYDLVVDDGGKARLTVRTGRVAFEAEGREVILPRGFWCETIPGDVPNVPLRVDAPAAFVEAVRASERNPDPDPGNVERIVSTDVREDSVTLWHLFLFAESAALRDAVYALLTRVYPLPRGFDEADLRSRNEEALRAWRDQEVKADWPGGFMSTLRDLTGG